MFLHEFRDDLVFPPAFRLEFGDASFIDVDGVDPRLLESGGAVLEELFPPGQNCPANGLGVIHNSF